MTARLSEQQLAGLRVLAENAENRPLMLSDCEGVLKVWAVSALTHVTRDESGEITGWSEPGSYRAADLVAEVELDMGSWDPGEDADDDQRRQDIGELVTARAAVPALLAEAEQLRAERDQFADRVDTLTAVAKSNKRHVATLTEELATSQSRIAELERQLTTAATARVPGLCPPCKRGDCDECMAIDHPDLPGLYTCHYVPNPHQVCREGRRGGERP